MSGLRAYGLDFHFVFSGFSVRDGSGLFSNAVSRCLKKVYAFKGLGCMGFQLSPPLPGQGKIKSQHPQEEQLFYILYTFGVQVSMSGPRA